MLKHQWPPASATIEDNTATVTIAGIEHQTHAGTLEEARDAARAEIAAWARHFSRPLKATVTDPEGTWTINVTGDGTARDEHKPTRRWRHRS